MATNLDDETSRKSPKSFIVHKSSSGLYLQHCMPLLFFVLFVKIGGIPSSKIVADALQYFFRYPLNEAQDDCFDRKNIG